MTPPWAYFAVGVYFGFGIFVALAWIRRRMARRTPPRLLVCRPGVVHALMLGREGSSLCDERRPGETLIGGPGVTCRACLLALAAVGTPRRT